MPLYRVRLNLSFAVKAKNEKEALELAFSQREEIVRNDIRHPRDCLDVCAEIRTEKDLPDGWSLECLPWGEPLRSSYCMVEDLQQTNNEEDEQNKERSKAIWV